MVSRTILDDRQISTLPSKEGVIVCIYSHPKKSRFFDTKPKCGSNCGQNLRPTRINTGVSADFRLQPQKPRFRTWVSGDFPHCTRHYFCNIRHRAFRALREGATDDRVACVGAAPGLARQYMLT